MFVYDKWYKPFLLALLCIIVNTTLLIISRGDWGVFERLVDWWQELWYQLVSQYLTFLRFHSPFPCQ